MLKKDGTLWLNLGDSYWGSGGPGGDYDRMYKGDASSIAKLRYKNPNKGSNKTLKTKDLCGIPWRVALALQADGWYLRQDIIWSKKNPMPESVTDRCTKSHEYIFLLSKSAKYHYDSEAIKENSVNPESYSGRRFRNAKAIEMANTRLYNKPNTIEKGNNGDGKTYLKRNKRSVWTVNTQSYSGAHFATFPVSLIADCIKAGCPEGETVLDPFFGSGTTGEAALRLNRCFTGIELNQDYIKLADDRLKPFFMPDLFY